MGARFGQVAAAALTLALAGHARAMHMANLLPPEELVIGPSLAYGSIVGAADHPLLGVDVTYGRELFWATLGARLLADEHPTLMPYAEVGVCLVLNIGAGVTFLAHDRRQQSAAPHLFLGLPVPFVERVDVDGRGVWFVEPYYRPLWWEGNALHEVGLLVKVFAWTGSEQPPKPRRPDEPPLVDPPAESTR
jgi:hypothetical protein